MILGEIYHVFTKSIAGFRIFNEESDFLRIIEVLQYYQKIKRQESFYRYKKNQCGDEEIENDKTIAGNEEKFVDIIAYCVMPTHLHLLLNQLAENGISIYMNNILNSYTRFFNIKHKRKGPLWEGRFKKVFVEDDEQLLHLTRYIHLNPLTAGLVNKAENWKASSYVEYIERTKDNNRICQIDEFMEMSARAYKEFVENRISYQKELAKIKHIIFKHE